MVGMIPTEHVKMFTNQTKCTIKNVDEECWSGDASKKLPEILVAHTQCWEEVIKSKMEEMWNVPRGHLNRTFNMQMQTL